MKLFLYFLFLAASSLIINSGLAIEGRAPSVASQFPNGALHNRQEWVPLQADDFTSGRPFPPTSASWKDPSAEIFVTIADYRDRLCGQTLYELYSKAEYPERVYVGLVQQSKPDDTDCIVSYCSLMGVKSTSRSSCPHIHQIRAMLMSIQEARGPMFARSYHGILVQDEEFCLQLDSHMKTVQHWDSELVQMWGRTNNEYAVLSTAPLDISEMDTFSSRLDDFQEVPHLCNHYFTEEGLPKNVRPTTAFLKDPILTAGWSAGFSFSKCHLDAKVPYDPNYPNLADGEDFSRYARMWTAGYDVYSPPRSVFYHDYKNTLSSSSDLTEWIDMGMSREFVKGEHDAAVRRMQLLLDYRASAYQRVAISEVDAVRSLGRYGLGNRRTLDDFIQFTGVDLRAGVVFKDSCTQLSWIPSLTVSGPWVSDGDVWGLEPERFKENSMPLMHAGKRRGWETKGVAVKHNPVVKVDAKSTTKSFIYLLAGLVDPLVEAIRHPFVNRLGIRKGEKTLRVFLATVPLFFGVVLMAYFVLLPSESQDDPKKEWDNKNLLPYARTKVPNSGDSQENRGGKTN